LRRRPPRVLLLWGLGGLVILTAAIALSDPAIVMFALDPELVALLVISSLALLRGTTVFIVLRGLVARLRGGRRR
jgi:hypothetical protein